MDAVHPRMKRPYKRTNLPQGWCAIAREAGISPTTYYERRLEKHLSHEEALSRPVRPQRRRGFKVSGPEDAV